MATVVFPNIPGYQIVRKIAEGGSAEIYKARRQPHNNECAIKLLHIKHKTNKRMAKAFESEGTMLERLKHEHIINFHRRIPNTDRPAMELELFDSGHLKRLMVKSAREKKPVPLNESIFILFQILDALVYLHGLNIIHKDLKPENVLVGTDNNVKLIDFSIAQEIKTGFLAKLFHKEPPPEGTPTYISPEQIMGKGVDLRADLYSFGAMAYEVLADRPPLAARSRQALFKAHMTEKPPLLASLNKAIPKSIAEIIDRCLQKVPAARPSHIGLVRDAFKEFC